MNIYFHWGVRPTYIWASQVVLVVKNLLASAGDIRGAGSIPGSGRSPRESNGNLLQYSCLENPMDRGVWWAIHSLNYQSSAEVMVVGDGLVTKSCLTLATHGL